MIEAIARYCAQRGLGIEMMRAMVDIAFEHDDPENLSLPMLERMALLRMGVLA